MKKDLMAIEQREVLGKEFKIYGTLEEPLFLAKEVASWVDYCKTGNGKYDVSNMLKWIDKDEKIKVYGTTIDRTTTAVTLPANRMFLTEDGLYEVLMQSRKPIAKSFKKEVKKILKTIRLNGMYASDKLLDDPDMLLKVVTKLTKEREEKLKLQKENQESTLLIEKMQPKVDFADRLLKSEGDLLVRQYAKVLQDKGFNMGEKKLFKWLRDNNYLMDNKKSRNEPYQHYMKYFSIVERTIYRKFEDPILARTTKITPEGQLFLYKKLSKEFDI